MKHVFLFLFLVISAASFSQSEMQTDFNKLNWLIGTWSRTNITKPGRTATEVWSITGENKLGGTSVTLQGSDTVFIEKFEMVVRDNAIYYVADVPENTEPVYFKVTSLSNNSFVCENPQHDFPKKISYHWDGTTLKAQISGNGKSSDFIFKRN
jgi:hypothetical protein